MRWRSLLVLLAVAVALLAFATPGSAANPTPPTKVLQSNRNDVSPALRTMAPLPITGKPKMMPAPHDRPLKGTPQFSGKQDPLARPFAPNDVSPAPIINVDGQPNTFGGMPPDTQGDVGLDHYVQWNNLSFAVYDKATGAKVYPAGATTYAAGNTLWQGFGGACETSNDGDPVTIFDEVAQRWVMSQFALPFYPDPPYFECVAVSQTSDPTGAWYRYEFGPFDAMNDYPKMGVWSDAYYMTANMFGATNEVGVWALERSAMLGGFTARAVYFGLASLPMPAPSMWSMLPADFEGTPPVAGTPNIVAGYFDGDWATLPGEPTEDSIVLYEFAVDWADPTASTFTHLADVPVAEIEPYVCVNIAANRLDRNCIDQPSPATYGLDSISGRLLHRLQYRNFGTRQTLVTNMTVNVTGVNYGQAGVRWFELEESGAGWDVADEGTTPSADGTHRWMGSAAMDASGNLAVGYSVSSLSVYPGVSYAAREAGGTTPTPAGTLDDEQALVVGSGVQLDFPDTPTSDPGYRWGDYSAMQVDPVDECTFWYTQEYYKTSSAAGFSTRIGSFKYPDCTAPDKGTLNGTVTDADTGDPIPGATITWGDYSTATGTDGTYSIDVLPGTHDASAWAFSYLPVAPVSIEVITDTTTIQDFVLTKGTTTEVDGWVRDAQSLMPLYARVTIAGIGGPSQVVYTDPGNGYYNVTVYEGQNYVFTAEAVLPGYATEARDVVPPAGGDTVSFYLVPDATCTGPGYRWNFTEGEGLIEGFESLALPAGWTVEDLSDPATGAVWTFDDPEGWTNNTPGSGGFADASSFFVDGDIMDTALITPEMDFSAVTGATLTFDTIFATYEDPPDYYSTGYVDVSTDSGATWTTEWEQSTWLDPTNLLVDLSDYDGEPSVMVRFRYEALYDWLWQIDNVRINAFCEWIGGGVVYGLVKDANTHLGLNGAQVETDNNPTWGYTSATTGFSPSLGAGFYSMYVPGPSFGPNTRTWTASKAQYATSPPYVGAISPGGTLRLDFELATGQLAFNPSDMLYRRVDPLGNATQTFSILNSGGAAADFTLVEFNVKPATNAPVKKYPAMRQVVSRNLPSLGVDIGREMLPPKHRSPIGEAPETITPGTDLPQNRYRHGAASCDGSSYYVAGGYYNPSGTTVIPQDTLWRYDPGTSLWTPLAPMPVALANVQAACVGNTLYVVGGYTGTAVTNDFLIYDVSTDTWASSTLPFVGAGIAAVAHAGQLWLFGGSGALDYLQGTWVYDPSSDTWTQKADMPVPAGYASAVTVGNFIYVIGGWGTVVNNTVRRYDPATDTWDTSGPTLNFARQSFVAANYGGSLFVLGGGTGTGGWTAVTAIETYNPAAWPAGSWSIDPENLTTYIYPAGAAGACANDMIWISGGRRPYAENWAKDDSALGFTCSSYSADDIPWFEAAPTTGTVPAASEFTPLTGTFDATQFGNPLLPFGMRSGMYRAQLFMRDTTPYPSPVLPLNFIIRYEDVPDTSGYQSFIYAMSGAGLTAGCDWTLYCPTDPVPREQMAVFMSVAMAGSGAAVPVSGTVGAESYNCIAGGDSVFDDVAPEYPYCRFIHYLAANDIPVGGGCTPDNFCPTTNLTRRDMAAWLAAEDLDGAAPPVAGDVEVNIPPAAPYTFHYNCVSGGQSYFSVDVKPTNPYCPAIHYIWAQKITAGCGPSQFCQLGSTLREQMAVFLTVAFDIYTLP